MKRVNISNLVPGMITAEDVYTYGNQLIIPKHTILNDKAITRLEFYSIVSIRVEDAPADLPTPAVASSSAPGDIPYSQWVQSTPEFKKFKQDYDESVDDFKNSINDIVEKGSEIQVDEVLQNTMELFQNDGNTFSFFNMMQNMRQYDDMTYAHCINVSLISNVLATWLHLPQKDIEMATLCGLFHDIGKLAIPDKIIKKPDKLTDQEYAIVKKHTIEGYNILKNQKIHDHIKNTALMHHERCDGTGYPLGIGADRIDKFAKIVSIADVYDAMTAARVYRGPLCPFSVIEIFEKEGLQKYETEYILCFLENVVLTYMNNRVRLSNGLEGDIVYINRQILSKPMVKCGEQFIDLSVEKDLSITEII
ncbi:MAG: HD-GYP domain-containing protein [Lachnospiraceae bacterium]|nr:HD-GYP domain-containing protein [Lachnospiraceae bacterium]